MLAWVQVEIQHTQVYAADVKSMNMRRQYTTEEKYAIEHAIPLETGQQCDRERWEEDVDDGQADTVAEPAHSYV